VSLDSKEREVKRGEVSIRTEVGGELSKVGPHRGGGRPKNDNRAQTPGPQNWYE
jgi:hypothetical protein